MKRLLALGALVLLAACASPDPGSIPTAPAQRLYQAQATLVTAQAGALVYSSQPFCDTPLAPKPPACASKPVVIQLARASQTATDAVKVAQTVVASATSPQATILDRVGAAEKAVSFLGAVLSQAK